MYKRTIAVLLAGTVLLATYAATRSALATEEDDCDIKTVVKGYYSETCDRVLEKKELVSDKTYYECSDCGLIEDAEGECGDCEKAFVKKTSEKDVCPDCYEKPAEAEICVKTCFECPDCGERKAAAGECKECEEKLTKTTVPALIQYQCPELECDESYHKPGKCQNKECDHHDKPLVRACTESGVFPHVKEKAKPEKP